MVLSPGASSTSLLVEIDNGGSETVGKVFPCQKNLYGKIQFESLLAGQSQRCTLVVELVMSR